MEVKDLVDVKKRLNEGWSGQEILGEAVYLHRQKNSKFSPSEEESKAEAEYLRYRAPKPPTQTQSPQAPQTPKQKIENSFLADLVDFSGDGAGDDGARRERNQQTIA